MKKTLNIILSIITVALGIGIIALSASCMKYMFGTILDIPAYCLLLK